MQEFDSFKLEGKPMWDLYHGAGGFSMGFSNLGWSVVGGIDLDPDAGDTVRTSPRTRLRKLTAVSFL